MGCYDVSNIGFNRELRLLVLLSRKPFDSTLKHDNGFDVAANCPRKIGLDNSPLECCGEYPPRFPYKTKDGQRGCCFDKTYDVELQECCMDYSLSLVCEN